MDKKEEPARQERQCLACERIVHVVHQVGPLEIKERCPYKCTQGYVRVVKERQP